MQTKSFRQLISPFMQVKKHHPQLARNPQVKLKTFSEILKFNPYHGKDGRFTTSGSAASFTYKPGASTAHSKAIEREMARDTDSQKGFKGTLYHGSPNTDIKEFDMKRAGQNTSSGEKLLFFTDSKQMADDFSYERLEGSSKFFQERGKKGRVYEVDVEMKNPLDFRKLNDKDIDNILKLDEEGLLTKDMVQRYANSNHQLLKAGLTLTSDSLKNLGYDGLIANTGKAGHNSIEYAVIDSSQAKIKKSIAKSFSDILKYNQWHGKDGRFTSGPGGGAGAAGFTPAKTIEEAQEYAIKHLGMDYADYDNCNNDIKTINMINEQITKIYEKYPDLKGAIHCIESPTTGLDNSIMAVGPDTFDEGNAFKIGFQMNKGYSEMQKTYQENVDAGFHPKGTTLESAIWHEFGHVYELENSKPGSGPVQWIDEARGNKDFHVYQNSISGYATKNAHETFAEAFAEYNTSKFCRPEANRLMKAAGVVKKPSYSKEEEERLRLMGIIS